MEIQKEITKTIRSYNQRGWSPATSTNYSFVENGKKFVSKSGIDKSLFNEQDFLEINLKGESLDADTSIKPSAETLIHCTLYELFPETKVILHSHSVYAVLNSQKYEQEILFEGYEIQKGFKGQTTHENQVSIPIFENTQDMQKFTTWMNNRKIQLNNYCFIIKNHGCYAWGNSLFEAKRHLESLEYLLEINWKLNF